MSTVVDDLATLRTRFLGEWGDPVQTLMDNQPNELTDETEPFVRFTVNPANNSRLALGGANTLHRQYGRVWLQIFTPRQEGASMAYTLADRFAAIFRNWSAADGSVRCQVESYNLVPNEDYYQVNVSVPYYADRTA